MRYAFRLLPALCALVFVAACSNRMPRPSPPPPPAAPSPAPASSTSSPAPAAVTPTDLWSRMRQRFAMPGCDADPGILHWAGRFTRHPHGFERYLRSVTPTVAYIEAAAKKAGVPAEFSLLPWVESRYRAVPPRGHRSAGMWQIVPATAHTLHLPMQHNYDARLDRVRSTSAVMDMLHGYHQRWQDWRLVDMAFNAGEFRIRHLQATGPAPEDPVVPDLSVSPITRDHLTKLLAMACVIREPQRFGVHLPELADADRLRDTILNRPATLATIARVARVPLKRVRKLNGAYLHGRMPGQGPWHVLLPVTGASRLHQSMAAGTLPRQPATYTVNAGDSLWQIAQRHDLSVSLLRRLNHLHGNVLHPGQVLQIESAR